MAPTAIGEFIERDGNKGLIGKRTVQIEALGDLNLTRSQLTLLREVGLWATGAATAAAPSTMPYALDS